MDDADNLEQMRSLLNQIEGKKAEARGRPSSVITRDII